MAEGAPLLREYVPKAHRGFESLRLRQTLHSCGLASSLGSSADVLLQKTAPQMPLPAHLVQRRAGVAFRLTIPSDLRPSLGLREVVRSLKPTTRRGALARCRRAAQRGRDAFDMLRKMDQKARNIQGYQSWGIEQRLARPPEGFFTRATPLRTRASAIEAISMPFAAPRWVDSLDQQFARKLQRLRPRGRTRQKAGGGNES